MERQKRRNKSEEFHGYVNGVIDDYKRWIEYLRCLNEFDAAVKENDLKQAFETKKNEYDEKIKRLDEEILSLTDQLNVNQDQISSLKDKLRANQEEIYKLTNDAEQMNIQVNQKEVEIKSKGNIIDELEVNLYYEKNRNYELETKLHAEQEQSARLYRRWEDVYLEYDEERRSAANLRQRIVELQSENEELKSNYHCWN
ncbi:hypothetical protein C2G38_2040482 [Gigaspora rosea]|uniref:Uncharacterized protein n=1 Tax=Gigaspora rosea TaxID=44941 RepID=A0A397UW83_9GLOM|nr:hypothetical protein C2G38_2040482 [Gigaspora rosea]